MFTCLFQLQTSTMTRISIIASGKPNPNPIQTANQIVVEREHRLYKTNNHVHMHVSVTCHDTNMLTCLFQLQTPTMTRISIITSGKPNPHTTQTANQIVVERGHGIHKANNQTCLQVLLTIVTLVMVATSVMAMVFYVSLLTQQCDTGAPTATTTSTPQYGVNRTAMTYGERYESWIEAPGRHAIFFF